MTTVKYDPIPHVPSIYFFFFFFSFLSNPAEVVLHGPHGLRQAYFPSVFFLPPIQAGSPAKSHWHCPSTMCESVSKAFRQDKGAASRSTSHPDDDPTLFLSCSSILLLLPTITFIHARKTNTHRHTEKENENVNWWGPRGDWWRPPHSHLRVARP